MANTITDNRTAVDNADSATPYDNLAGVASGNLDTDVKVQGSGSIAEIITSTLNGVLFDAASAQDWSNNVFYIWINCGVVGLLKTKTNAGFTIRFCGATVTDWFEVYVGGSDSWPTAVVGGWVQFVVDIEDARAAAIIGTVGGTNGTTPATTAIRYIGWSGITASVMTKMIDNTWIDEIRRLPDGNPGIIIQGRNGGTTDWSFSDIVSELGVSVGTAKNGAGGAIVLNTPVQFGADDTVTHGFTDTNKIVLWETQEFAPIDLYGFKALGNVGGTTNVTIGIKTGTGDSATGAQGGVIAAEDTAVRWAMDFNDPDLDSIGLFGLQLIHGGTLLFDDDAVDMVSCTFLDCDAALISNSNQLKNKIIAANTADSVAFMTTDDLADIAFSEFEFSDGHGVEITAIGTYTFLGNLFAGYSGTPGDNNTPSSGSTDAAIFNNSGGLVTINIGSGGDTPAIRNAAGSTTVVNNDITITFTGMKDDTQVRVERNDTRAFIAGIEDVISGSVDDRSFSFSAAAGLLVNYILHNYDSGGVDYESIRVNAFEIPAGDQSIPIQQRVDRNSV